VHSQKALDAEICTVCCDKPCLVAGGASASQNALRQMVLEAHVGALLLRRARHFDVALVTSADLFFGVDVDAADAWRAAMLPDAVFTTAINEGPGAVTDGWYLGRAVPLARILMRWRDWPAFAHMRGQSYEEILGASFDHYRIERRVSRLAFVKIRATGEDVWGQGHMIAHLSSRDQRRMAQIRVNLSQARTLDGRRVDCPALVRQPRDVPPVRSPQAVHTAIAHRLSREHELVEIGTRNGDGLSCLAQVVRRAAGASTCTARAMRWRRSTRT
jgi:hypothetical protein